MSRHRKVRLVLAAVAAVGTLEGSQLLAEQRPDGGFATRFTSSGSVDTSFGVDGVNYMFEPDGSAVAAAIDSQNRIVIAGTRNDEFVVTRLGVSGGTDRTFGNAGVATKSFPARADARAVAIDPWGRIIVAGNSAGEFAVACFTESGDKCPFSFGGDSKVTTGFAHPAEAAATAIDSYGRIVVGGTVRGIDPAGKNERFAIVRYNSTGGLDSSFGVGGKVVYDVAPAPFPPDTNRESISGIAIDPYGRIVAAGTFAAQNVSPQFAVIRFHGNGLPDATFGPHSTGLATGFGGCSWAAGCFEKAEATSLVLQSNGKIVVAGWAKRLGSGFMDGDAALVRFLPDGSRDSSGFGIDGYVLTDGGGNMARANSVKIAGGGLFVAGWAFSPEQAMIARYSLSDGALDGGFGLIVGSSCPPDHKTAALTLVVQSFPCRGTVCVPTHKPVIAGPCISYF